MLRKTKKCSRCEREISLSNIKRHEIVCYGLGHSAWNYGLKKENDFRIAKSAKSLSRVIQTKIANGTFKVNVISNEAKEKLSLRMSIKNPGGKCKWFDVNNEKVQGTWERDLAIKMSELQIFWTKRNQTTLSYKDSAGNIRKYTPDFLLIEHSIRIELKGFWWGNDRQKMLLVLEQNKLENIIVVQQQLFQKLLLTKSQEEFLNLLGNAIVVDLADTQP